MIFNGTRGGCERSITAPIPAVDFTLCLVARREIGRNYGSDDYDDPIEIKFSPPPGPLFGI